MADPTSELKAALTARREELVKLVTRRNALSIEADRLERSVADIETKAALADRINNPDLAAELRRERAMREEELIRLRTMLVEYEARIEAEKFGVADDERTLPERVAQARTTYVTGVGEAIERGSIGGGESDVDNLWNRASAKIGALTAQASSQTTGSAPRAQTADEMLRALEERLGLQASTIAAETAPEVKQFNVVLPRGEPSRMEPTQRVRVAAIGTGSIFRGAHLPQYPEIPQVQLVAICDPDKNAQDAAYKKYQALVEAKIKQATAENDVASVERFERDLETVQICDDISEVIETVKPDLVDICTQPFLHAPLSIQALDAGIHVMCEKPMARSWLETQRVIEAVKRSGKFYQHNENWLWDGDYYTAKKLVDAGAIGEPILMYLATAHGGPEGAGKFWNSNFGGGGALLDNGIHAIGASWFISGLDKRPTMVKAAEPFGMTIRMPKRIIDGRYQDVQVDDDAHILIRFENPDTGAWSTAHVEGSWSHRDSPDTAIIGTTGKIVFRSEEKTRLVDVVKDVSGNVVTKTYATSEGSRTYAVVLDSYDREQRRIETGGPTWQHWPSSFYGEILNMAECVRNNVQSMSDPYFGADCSAIVGAAYLSEGSGRKASSVDAFKAFAKEIGDKYGSDLAAADEALVTALLSAVRDKK